MPASISYNTTANSAGADVTSLSLDLSGEDVQPGDHLLAIFGSHGNVTHGAPTYDGGEKTGQDAGFSSVQSGGTAQTLACFKKVGAKPFDNTGQSYKSSWSGAENAVAVGLGIRGDNDIDVTGTVSASSGTSPVTLSITTTVERSLNLYILLAADNAAGTLTITNPTGTTSVVSNLRSSTGGSGGIVLSIVSESQLVAGVSGNKTWTLSESSSYVTFALGVKVGDIERLYIVEGSGARRVAITIDATKVSGSGGTVSKCPILLTHANLPDEMKDSDDATLSNSGTFKFSVDSAGRQRLPLYVHEHTPNATPASATSEMYLWNPGLSQDTDPVIYGWYGLSGQTQPAASARYGSQEVVHWECKRFAVDPVTDISANAHNNETTGSNIPPTSSDAAVGLLSRDFDGSSDRISISDHADFDIDTELTWIGWAERDSAAASWKQIMSKFSLSPVAANYLFGYDQNANLLEIGFYNGSFKVASVSLSANWAASTWAQFCVYIGESGSSVLLKLFKNGSQTETINSTQASTSLVTNSLAYMEGDIVSLGRPFNGRLDTVLFIKGDWRGDIWTTMYNNQSSPSTFASAGTPEDAYQSPVSVGSGIVYKTFETLPKARAILLEPIPKLGGRFDA